jgi:tetratricopeptide (TPR) repeat protein
MNAAAARFLTGCGLLMITACGFPRIVILHDPLTAEEHLRLGRLYEQRQEWAAAKAEYEEALESASTADLTGPARVGLANAYAQLGRSREAERLYREILKENSLARPLRAQAGNNLAWLYLQQGRDLAEAVRLAESASKEDPERAGYFLHTLASIRLRMGEPLIALETVQNAEAVPGVAADPTISAALRSLREEIETALRSSERHAEGDDE